MLNWLKFGQRLRDRYLPIGFGIDSRSRECAWVRVEHNISFKLNGKAITVKCPPAYTLLEVLRDQLQVTGPKEDCAKGECGACTVIMNGLPVCSCLVLVSQAEDSDIITSEGLVKDGRLNAVQEAFIDHGAVQCGHCIPGMIVSASALLMRKRRPTRQDIQDALSGNLCRCTGYTKIIAAVEDAAKKTRP